MSISQNSASAAEDGLSPALLMIEEFSHRALNDYMGAICMLRGAADEVGDSAARAALADDKPTPEQMEQAKAAYAEGKAFHDAGKLPEAIDKFKESR